MGRQANGTCPTASKKSHPAPWPQGYVGQDSREEKRKPMLSESPIPVEEYRLSVAVSRDAVNARFRRTHHEVDMSHA